MFITNNIHSKMIKLRKTKLPGYGSIFWGAIRIYPRGKTVTQHEHGIVQSPVLQNYTQDGFQIKSCLYFLGGEWRKNTNKGVFFSLSLLDKINAGMFPL